MLEMILGFGLGAMAFTETGRQLGNKAADFAFSAAKKVLTNDAKAEDKPAEQSSGTAGHSGSSG